jgi:hypothetical protein
MSTLRTDTLSNSAGSASVPVNTVINGSAKAWVNFNGTTSPGTIRASFNVSSVTRNGTGDYPLNFTNAMPDANYATQVTANQDNSSAGINTTVTTVGTNLVRIRTGFGYYTNADMVGVYVTIFR